MSDRNFDGAEKIHINCPYCWTEFQNFEQIGSNIDYKYHLYDDFLIFPIESRILQKPFFGKRQLYEIIRCPHCERNYTIVFLPFGLAPETKRNTKSNNQNKATIRLNNFLSNSFQILSSWKYFLLFNWAFLLVILYFLTTQNYVLFASFFFLLFSEFVLIATLPSFSDFFKNFKTIEKMPLELHKKYIETHHFKEFKEEYFESEYVTLRQKEITTFLSLILILTIFGAYAITCYSIFISPINLFLKLLQCLILFGVFGWIFYLGLVIYSYIPLLLDSFEYLMFVSSKIPMKIKPWDEKLHVEVFKDLWLYSSITCLFIGITIPIILVLSSIIQKISDIVITKDPSAIMLFLVNYFIHNFAVFFYFIIIIAFIVLDSIIIYNFYSNIARRKKDLVRQTKNEIIQINKLPTLSNSDVFRGALLLKKIERINAISTFTFNDSVKILLSLTPFAITLIQIVIKIFS